MSRLAEYWIDQIKNTEEFKLLDTIEEIELDKLQQAITDLIDDQFIETATLKGVERREKILRLTPFYDDTLESRRFRVLTQWNSSLPYTQKALIKLLEQLCGESGYKFEINYGEYTLKVGLALSIKRMEQEVASRVRKMVPANMLVNVELMYRKHEALRLYTHEKMATYSHYTLREETIK